MRALATLGSLCSKFGAHGAIEASPVDRPSIAVLPFKDPNGGGNNLFGSSTHASVPLSATLLKETVQPMVLGGGGIFAGATGTGQSTACINPNTGNAVDSASLSVAVVPEPSTSALMIAGLLGVGALSRRRHSWC